MAMPGRQRFLVASKDGETTVVSWKQLVTDAERGLGSGVPSDAPAGANPALEARIAPEKGSGSVADAEDALPQAPNRFSSVIERIERLYKGGDSDDDNAEDSPDEDQYDTDDPFIDDEELNEYFMVEKAKTKHTGFFINRGALEKISVAPLSPKVLPKKRKRRETKRVLGDKKLEEKEAKRRMKGRMKTAARLLHSQTLGGLNAEISREHAIRTQACEPEEISSDSDDYLQQPAGLLGTSYNPEKQELAGKSENKRKEGGLLVTSGVADLQAAADTNYLEIVRWKSRVEVDNNGGTVERPLEASNAHTSKSMYEDVREGHNRSEYRHGSSTDEKKWKEAAREPKGVIKVSESLKMKMMQQSVKEEGTRDSDGVAGKATADFTKSSSPGPKESSPGRLKGWPKGTVMERAIQDLIKIVALPEGEEPEQPSQSGGKAKRLPREVKLRLAKVARLAQAKQGKVPDELVERLNGILGHVMRPNTMKRNLKEMVEHGLSAKQEKEGRLQDIKREVTEMVRSRVTSLQMEDAEVRESSCDDFQTGVGAAEKAATSSEKYKWDHAIEDLLCNLYEQYLEGMDEHKGPQIRKLYIELAELWPEGWMDNNGIKAAVSRAKERKKLLTKLNKEPRKRQKAGSSSDRPRTKHDSGDGRRANPPSQLFAHLLPKPKTLNGMAVPNDDSIPEGGLLFLPGAFPLLPPAVKILKRKPPPEGAMKSPMKASKLELKERGEYIREGMVFDEKSPLIKKRRKKVKPGTEVDLTLSPLLFGKSEGLKDFLRVSTKKLPFSGELPAVDLGAGMEAPKLTQLEKPQLPTILG